MLKISMNPMQLPKILPTNASLRCSGDWADRPSISCSDTRVLLSYPASFERGHAPYHHKYDATRQPLERTSENLPSTHSGELTLETWLLQRPTHREIMAPLSTAGTHPLFNYI